jgi:hypothetical protein
MGETVRFLIQLFRVWHHLPGLFSWAVAFVLMSASSSFAGGILWWNVGGGNFLRPSEVSYDRSALEKNLLNVIQKESPEVVILGEYYPGFFNAKTVSRLRELFPAVHHFPYNRNLPLGILVFSKKNFEYHYYFEKLPWREGGVPKNLDPSHPTYLRSFQRIRIRQESGQELNIVPVHTMMPWNQIMRDDSGFSKIDKNWGGKIDAAYEILFSEDHPLAYQMKQFQKILRQERERSQKNATWIVLGDFNVVSQYAFKNSPTFDLIRDDLNSAERREGTVDYSFPVPGTYPSQKLQIDHVVSNLDSARVTYEFLPKKGSDHFPMLVNFRPE